MSARRGGPVPLSQCLDQFVRGMLHEIMVDADKAYWLRRADQFEAAGLDEIATACRNKASLCEPEDWADDLNNVMSERH